MSSNQFQINGVLMLNGAVQYPIMFTFPPCTSNANRKLRLRWTPELHEKFVAAIVELGGATEAKPTAIIQAMERMGVYGLTLRQVKSHLQKYRTIYKQDKDKEGEQPQGAEDNNMQGMNNGTMLPIMVPTPSTEGQKNMSEKNWQGVLEQMDIEKNAQMLQEVHGSYMASSVEKASGMAVWELFDVYGFNLLDDNVLFLD